jgi:hypothetical protein
LFVLGKNDYNKVDDIWGGAQMFISVIPESTYHQPVYFRVIIWEVGMAPEFIGAIIALVSALIAVVLVEFLAARRAKTQRAQDQIERSRKEHGELMKPRYEQTALLAGKINQENLGIIEGYYIAERSQQEYQQTFKENVASLHGQLVDKQALNNNNQLLSVTQTIGDEELIDAAGELIGIYNSLLGRIERKFNPGQAEIQFTMEDTQLIESARSETLFYYGRITKRLDTLQNGIWVLEPEVKQNSDT